MSPCVCCRTPSLVLMNIPHLRQELSWWCPLEEAKKQLKSFLVNFVKFYIVGENYIQISFDAKFSSISFSVSNFCVIFFLLESTVTIYTDKIFGFSQHLRCLWESNICAIDGHWISKQKFESTMYRFHPVSKKWYDCTHLPINLHATFNPNI